GRGHRPHPRAEPRPRPPHPPRNLERHPRRQLIRPARCDRSDWSTWSTWSAWSAWSAESSIWAKKAVDGGAPSTGNRSGSIGVEPVAAGHGGGDEVEVRGGHQAHLGGPTADGEAHVLHPAGGRGEGVVVRAEGQAGD